MNLITKILLESEGEENLFKPRKLNNRQEQVNKQKEEIINRLGGIDKVKDIWILYIHLEATIIDYLYYVKAESIEQALQIIGFANNDEIVIERKYKLINNLTQLESFERIIKFENKHDPKKKF